MPQRCEVCQEEGAPFGYRLKAVKPHAAENVGKLVYLFACSNPTCRANLEARKAKGDGGKPAPRPDGPPTQESLL